MVGDRGLYAFFLNAAVFYLPDLEMDVVFFLKITQNIKCQEIFLNGFIQHVKWNH